MGVSVPPSLALLAGAQSVGSGKIRWFCCAAPPANSFRASGSEKRLTVPRFWLGEGALREDAYVVDELVLLNLRGSELVASDQNMLEADVLN